LIEVMFSCPRLAFQAFGAQILIKSDSYSA
jgi:hypothetical protein